MCETHVVGSRCAAEGAGAERHRQRESSAEAKAAVRTWCIDQHATHAQLVAEAIDTLLQSRVNDGRVPCAITCEQSLAQRDRRVVCLSREQRHNRRELFATERTADVPRRRGYDDK